MTSHLPQLRARYEAAQRARKPEPGWDEARRRYLAWRAAMREVGGTEGAGMEGEETELTTCPLR